QDKFKPDFHLSLQSGCDATLRRMGRPYTGAEVAALCEQLRVLWPSARLSADILTGFPGESDAEFEETRRFLTGIRLDACHVFAYSPRPGTPAAAMENQVPQAAKRARSRMLREIKR
ncbi:MAG: radical SAM protein, partial [Oscillospiraceae bacterium]|nr:radical SAM protein [Oscillospiraceae bacterium]